MDTRKNNLLKNFYIGYTLMKCIKVFYILFAFNDMIIPIIIFFEITLSFLFSLFSIRNHIRDLDNSLNLQQQIISIKSKIFTISYHMLFINSIINLIIPIDSFITTLIIFEYLLYFCFLITNKILLDNNSHFIYYKFDILPEPTNNIAPTISSNDFIVNVDTSDNPYIINENTNNNHNNNITDNNILIFSYKINEKDNYINNECIICLEEYKDDDEIIRVKCNHLYHMNCYDEFVKTSQKCGICRGDMI